MPTATPARTVDITAAPRVVITLASGLVTRVFGDRMPSARDNAWQAVLEDRARAAQRAELADVLRDAAPAGARRPGTRPNRSRDARAARSRA
jgi:hypothetical protein